MPKKSVEFVVLVQQRGKPAELAGPYWQRRDAVRALTKLLSQFGWEPAVRAVAYERPSRGAWRMGSERDDRTQWVRVAHAEKRRGTRAVTVTETRAVA